MTVNDSAQGEAMTDLLPPYHKPMTSELDCDLANDRVAVLEAELERLRCCGNCRHRGDAFDKTLRCAEKAKKWREESTEPEYWAAPDLACLISPGDPCHLTPSRWTDREES